MPSPRDRGSAEEDRAAQHLRDRGYLVVARNWHSRFGEIDIIARDGPVLAFVEVRSRAGTGFGGAAASVGPAKRARIVLAARAYIAMEGVDPELPLRFDVVALEGDDVVVHRDAFQVDDRCSHGF